MKSRLLGKLVMFVAVLLGNIVPGHAQVEDAQQAQGVAPWASYQHSPIDSINLQSGFPTFHIRLFEVPQRGRLKLSFSLSGSNILYTTTKNPDCTQPSYQCYDVGFNRANRSFGFAWDQPLVAQFAQFRYPANSNTFYMQWWILDSTGATHLLGYDNSNNSQLRATDGSGLLVTTGTPWWYPSGNTTIYEPDGVQQILTSTNFTIQDPDGNFIVEQGTNITDSAGNVIPFGPGSPTSSIKGCPTISANWQPATSSATWTGPGPNGNSETFLFCYTSFTVRTQFWAPNHACSGGCQELTATTGSLQSVVLPNGTYWAFIYDAANPTDTTSIGYGQIAQIRLPTGGTISYQYVNQYQSTWTPPNVGRAVQQRTVDPGNGGALESFSYNYGMSTCCLTTTATDGFGNDSVYSFSDLGSGVDLHEITRQNYQGSKTAGTLLKTVTTQYSQASSNPQSGIWSGGHPGTKLAVFPTSVATTLSNGLATTTTYQYNDGGFNDVQPACQSSTSCTNSPTVPIPYGRVTSTSTTDYSGTTVRTVNTQYQYQQNPSSSSSPSPYFTANFMDLIASTTVLDGNNTQVAKTTYGYDENNGSPQGTLGHQTSVNSWLNTTGGNVTSGTVYNSQGMVSQSIDPLSNTTTVTYDATGVFPSQIEHPDTASGGVTTHHIVKYTYDPVVGKPLIYTDENGNQTTYSYDNMKRITGVTYPDPGSGMSYCYTDTGGSTCNQTSPPYQIVTNKNITSSQQPETTTTIVDGLGRVSQNQVNSDPSGADYVDTTYDALGRVASVSNPYRTTTDSTYGITQTQYDALGRVTQITKQDGGVGAISYEQVAAVVTNSECTLKTDEAHKQRRDCMDALGRLIEVDEPGGDTPGSAASGSLTISGSLQSAQTGHPASPGTGSVTIDGVENVNCINNRCYPDKGTVSITVNGHADSVSFAGASTYSSIAAGLVSAINGDSAAYVNAKCDDSPCSNGIVHVTARASGAGTNYSLSCGVTESQGSFGCSPSGTALTGGQDSVTGTTVYDAGTVSLSVGGYSAAANYGNGTGQDSTAAAVASDLASKIQAQLPASNPPFSISAGSGGTTITINWNSIGSAGNVTVTTNSTTTQTGYFSLPSFASCAISANPQSCSTTLSGGGNPAPASLSTPSVTLYSYDVLGNLRCAVQKGTDTSSFTTCAAAPAAWRPRSFTYDSLLRLLTASNPESGTVNYSYDANGNLLQKTSPAPNQTGSATQTITYCYDPLNRVTGKAYSAQTCRNGLLPAGTAVASYFYDQTSSNGLTIKNGSGMRTGMSDQAGNEAWSYDVMGRTVADQRTSNGVTKTTSYSYNLDGSLYTLTYPSGATVTYAYSNAAQAISAQDKANLINYATGALYAPPGGLSSLVNGTNLTSTLYYDKRLQPCRISVTTGSGVPANCADSTNVGNIVDLTYGFNLGTADNGNVAVITNNRDNTRTQSFSYDALNRISAAQTSAATGGNCWGEKFTYDAWGNMLAIGGLAGFSSCTQESGFSFIVTPNNQISTDAYDAAGNLTSSDPLISYSYDAENRISSAGGVTYTYDGDGKRVQKSNGKIYWYGTGGNALDETDLTGSITNSAFNEYVFFGGRRIARRDSSGNVFYYVADRLDTSRAIVQAGQTSSCYDADFYPFGGERTALVNTCPQNYKFTGKERDSESGLDHMRARYHSSAMGRFVSPDPAKKGSASANPQGLNLYSYALNNPLHFVDPDGQCSAPPVGHGQVGICVEAFIASKWVMGIGRGNNRGPTGNGVWKGETATFKTHDDIVVDLKSMAIVKHGRDAGKSGVFVPSFGLKGDIDSTIENKHVDKKGNLTFTLHTEGLNAYVNSPLPGPKGAIDHTILFRVDKNGTVHIDGGLRKAYPSLEVWVYDDKGNANLLRHIPEHLLEDLERPPDQEIPPTAQERGVAAVPPPDCSFGNKFFCFVD